MSPKIILVTGGAGYIGSVCTEQLISAGYKVVVIDNLSTGHRQAVHSRAKFVQGNIGNKSLMGLIFKKYKFNCVIHFAARTLVSEASTRPNLYFSNNVTNGLHLLDVMRESNCRKIIFSSSAAVYGEPKHTPISEHHPTRPLNAYGESKLMFEKVLKHYKSAFGLNYIVFRYFNPAGASKNYGEFHDPETHLVPLVLQVAAGNRTKFNIYGNDYDTPDGTCIRDFPHVEDIANAHILALKKIDQFSGSVYNLGSQIGFSVRQVISAATKITGAKIPVEIVSRRPGDPSRLVATSSRAKQELGWRPQYPDLKDIIASAWAWFQLHPRGYNTSHG